jgi:hypothetical protein
MIKSTMSEIKGYTQLLHWFINWAIVNNSTARTTPFRSISSVTSQMIKPSPPAKIYTWKNKKFAFCLVHAFNMALGKKS